MFDTLMVFMKEFFENIDFEKNQQTTKKHEKFPRGQRVTKLTVLTDTLVLGIFLVPALTVAFKGTE